MRTEQETKILKAIKDKDINNYIDINYWKLERDVLSDLLKEVLYLLPEERYNELYYNLVEYREFTEEEEEKGNDEKENN